MPKIDVAATPEHRGSGYPPPFDAPCAARVRQRLGDAGGLGDFGVNLMRLPPGNWSSQRHWHSHEDEFVYVLAGELTLIEDGGETVLRAGDCAAFPKNSGNGHHMINRTGGMAVYLEVGTRSPDDLTTCSDIDMMSANADGRFMHKDGTPYPGAIGWRAWPVQRPGKRETVIGGPTHAGGSSHGLVNRSEVSMARSGSSTLCATVLVLLLGGVGGTRAAETQRIRGTIEQVHGTALTIATREGPTVELTLAPDARIAALVPAELSSAGTGSFIGTAAVPQGDGTLRAQEVLIFPEAMRGVGEGHRAWDLTPDSTMTNATVEATVAGAAGRELTLTYKGGQKQLVVPPGTPIVTLEPGDASLLKAGNHVFLSAETGADGALTAARITVGKDGLVPPM